MRTILFHIRLILFVVALPLYAQEETEALIDVKIDVEESENSISIVPSIQNNGPFFYEYNYLLLVKKTDKRKNISINKQGGRFTLEPNETKILTRSSLNQGEKQNIKAYLYIRDENENKLIKKDSIEIVKNLNPVDESSLMLEGMVVDDTKTRMGKEFYDQFFSAYNQIPKKHKFIITIFEMPYRGQSSIIQLKADQDLLLEFFSNPDEEFNRQQVGIALSNLNKYAENKERLKKSEFMY